MLSELDALVAKVWGSSTAARFCRSACCRYSAQQPWCSIALLGAQLMDGHDTVGVRPLRLPRRDRARACCAVARCIAQPSLARGTLSVTALVLCQLWRGKG